MRPMLRSGTHRARCTAAAPRCSLCEREHRAIDIQCPVEGYMARKGQASVYGVAKCKNCRSPTAPRKTRARQRRSGSRREGGSRLPQHEGKTWLKQNIPFLYFFFSSISLPPLSFF